MGFLLLRWLSFSSYHLLISKEEMEVLICGQLCFRCGSCSIKGISRANVQLFQINVWNIIHIRTSTPADTRDFIWIQNNIRSTLRVYNEWERQTRQVNYLFSAPLLSRSRESASTGERCVLCVTSARDCGLSLPFTMFG